MHVEDYARRIAKDPAKERAKQDREREQDRRERAESIDEVFACSTFAWSDVKRSKDTTRSSSR